MTKHKLAALFAIALLSALDSSIAIAQAGNQPFGRPVVFNAPSSVRAGDVVGLQGAFFGKTPVVLLKRNGSDVSLPLLNTFDGGWISFKVPVDAPAALVVTVANGAAVSDALVLNGAHPHHLDALEVSPSGAFKLFGRSLMAKGFTPTVTFDGNAASIDLNASSEDMLVGTAPVALRSTSKPVAIVVDNGNGTGPSFLDRKIAVVGGGTDVFGLGVGWGGAFERIGAHVATFTGRSKPGCNGQTDDTPDMQAAIDQLAISGGGVLQLPAGICRFAGSLKLKSKVVLQGKGKLSTVIQYESSYPIWGRNLDLTGVADLTLKNTRGPIESPLLQNSTRSFFKNVRFELGGGVHMYMNGNTSFAVVGSEFLQPTSKEMNGPYVIAGAAGLTFVNNTTTFAHGSPSFSQVHDAYIGNNHFTRDYRFTATSKDVVHSLTLDFAHHVAVIGNTFDVLGGPVTNKFRNDGETILTEGGGGNRTENIGTVASATSSSLIDPRLPEKKTVFPSGSMPENFGVAIVSGTGAGQSRNITGITGTTINVSPFWSVVPDATSHYATFVWGLEKAIIKDNRLSQNPRGIWLYQTAIRDVDIIENSISEGGGILLRSAQNLKSGLFTPMYGVRIANNKITNTTKEWRSYISVMFVRMDEDEFGVGTTGVEVRNNQIVTNVPNLNQQQEDSGGVEGFINRMRAEGPSQARSLFQTRLLGTIFQNNHCVGCDIAIVVREGAQATVQDGNTNSLPAAGK